jgi:cysteine-rich repeat protein
MLRLHRPVALALLAAGVSGCFVDDPERFEDTAATASTSTSTTSTASSTSASATSTAGAAETSASTTEPAAVCGNGVLERGEACDDGNLDDLDACLSTCEIASCDDGVRSQDETDVDCGGACSPCDACGACLSDQDCAVGSCEPDELRCVFRFDVTIDYLANCNEPEQPSNGVTVAVPPGAYLATATPGSAGSVWSPPYTPPDRGWGWRAPCVGVNFTEMRTPEGVYYATVDEAFAALLAPSEAFTVAGDALECGLSDSSCVDNKGSVSFSARSLCE